MNYHIEVSKKLRTQWNIYKKQNKENQTYFAENCLLMSQGNFSNYLTGKCKFDLPKLKFFADALNIPVYRLLPDDFQPKPRIKFISK
jgi:hypothetical protein